MKKKELKLSLDLLKCFYAQMLSICSQHLSDAASSGGESNHLSLADFTLGFNLHTFSNYFVKKYIDKLQEAPDIKTMEKFKADWSEYFKNNIADMYKNGLEVRKKLLGMKNEKEEKIPQGDYYS